MTLPLHRTAPRLLIDLYRYDPKYTTALDNKTRNWYPCLHEYVARKRNLSVIDMIESPEHVADHSIATICTKCRIRCELTLAYDDPLQSCPNAASPLHYFQQVNAKPEEHDFSFVCLSESCRASLHVRYFLSVLDERDVAVFSQLDHVGQPKDDASLDSFSEQAQTSEQSAARKLEDVYRIVSHALATPDEQTTISMAHQRVFNIFGTVDGERLLRRIGFECVDDDTGMQQAWRLSKIDAAKDSADETEKFETIAEELSILMLWNSRDIHDWPTTESHPAASGFSAARSDLEMLLGANSYEKLPNRAQRFCSAENKQYLLLESHYSNLGIIDDFSDRLIAWTYDSLTRNLGKHDMTAFQSLKVIAAARQSEDLNTKVAMLESQGIKGVGELDNSFRMLNIDPKHSDVISDEVILGKYRSRFADVGSEERVRMVDALKLIGEARNSESLLHACSEVIETYEQALTWLGVNVNVQDDSILAATTAKISDDTANLTPARKALQIIADHRRSHFLRSNFPGEEISGEIMSLNTAFAMLGCADYHTVDEEMLLAHYKSSIEDATTPTRRAELRMALSIIAVDRDSVGLNSFLRAEADTGGQIASIARAEDPRGLKNIGNTCYLNSLLQYLFTIKPLRSLAEHLEDCPEDTIANVPMKKVGHVHVNKQAIERAQNFVEELQKLFNQLASAQAACVSPEEDLARLTLINVVDEGIRRRSTINGPAPLLDSPTTHLEVQDAATSIDGTVTGTTADTPSDQARGSVSDTSTIFDNGGSPAEEFGLKVGSDVVMTDANGFLAIEKNKDGTVVQVAEVSPENISAEIENSGSIPDRYSLSTLPERKVAKAEYEHYAEQQDVREVMGNVLGQLRWAIKADGLESDGEQVDMISKLFYGKENYTTLNESRHEESKIQSFSDIWIYMTSGPCDIYTAMDNTFDPNAIEAISGSAQSSQYRAITEAPPILQIAVQRSLFDVETKRAQKISDRLQLLDVICMDRYMEDPDMLEKRRKSWQLKTIINQLRKQKASFDGGDPENVLSQRLNSLSIYLRGIAANARELDLMDELRVDTTLASLLNLATSSQTELSVINAALATAEADLSNLFSTSGKYMYRLHAVFVHRGSGTGGHWLIYIYDSDKQIWRSYNDETVSVINNIDTVLSPTATLDGTSSFIVYIRDEEMSDIVQTVYRRPAPEEYTLPYSGR